MTQTVILRGPTQREFAHRLIDAAPDDGVRAAVNAIA